jgi:hypothetical protein
MNDKIGYTETSHGNKSATRLIFLIGSLWNMLMTTYLVYIRIEPAMCLAFFSGIEAVLIGLKLGQKPMENKINNKDKKQNINSD